MSKPVTTQEQESSQSTRHLRVNITAEEPLKTKDLEDSPKWLSKKSSTSCKPKRDLPLKDTQECLACGS